MFGHVLILAGSRNMLGAAALCGLSAMRSGAGLVTLGTPKSLNAVLQKKISSVIMTLSLAETKEQTLSLACYTSIKKSASSFDVIALGPGLSQNTNTQRLVSRITAGISQPLVIDADGLNALSENLTALKKNKGIKILTPHPGEMARLTGKTKKYIEKNRKAVALKFAKKYTCTLILKGHRTVVASPNGKTYINTTGNPGMATAGSGDVLTGMISAFLAQGLDAFRAAQYGVYLHGKAGDLAVKSKAKTSLIATDIIEELPNVLRIPKS